MKHFSCFVSERCLETSSWILRWKGEPDARGFSLITAGEILPGGQVGRTEGSYGKSVLRRGGSMRAHLQRSRTIFTYSSAYCTQDVREQQIEGCFFGRQNCPSAFINNYKIFFFVTSLTNPHSEHFHVFPFVVNPSCTLRYASHSSQNQNTPKYFFILEIVYPQSGHFHALLDGPRYILLLRQAGQSIQYFTLAYMLDFQSMV